MVLIYSCEPPWEPDWAYQNHFDGVWSKVTPYFVVQLIGSFLGAVALFVIYPEGIIAAGSPNVWKGDWHEKTDKRGR